MLRVGLRARVAGPRQRQAAEQARRQPPPPAPRWPDGRISFTGTAEDIGNWEGPANATLFFDIVKGKKVVPRREPADEQDGRRDSVHAGLQARST